MNKRQFLMDEEAENVKEIKILCPWVKHIISRENGHFCFERTDDYDCFKKQIKENPNLVGWGSMLTH